MNPPKQLSVIMPAYNEEGAIAAAVEEVQQHILNRVENSELIVVNDGSRDDTGTILDRLTEQDPRVRGHHKPNGGHGPALITGMELAEGEWFFLLDSDRQIPVEHFRELWAAVHNGQDAAFGVRLNRRDAAIRIVLTGFVRRTLGLLFGVALRDANIPFKLFRRSTWHQARAVIPEDTLAPSLFLAVFIQLQGLAIAAIPVGHKDRETGEVSIKRWRLFTFCWRGLQQLLKFRRQVQMRHLAAPARGA